MVFKANGLFVKVLTFVTPVSQAYVYIIRQVVLFVNNVVIAFFINRGKMCEISVKIC